MFVEILKWAKDVSLNPKGLTKKEYEYDEMIKRLVIVSLVPGILTAIISLVLPVDASAGQAAILIAALVSIPVFILSSILGPFINAVVVHFFGKFVFRLMSKDFKKTYNAVSYSMMPRLLTVWIPVVGGIVSIIWGIIVQSYAIANLHKITPMRGFIVTIIPIIITITIVVLLAFALVGSLDNTDLIGSAIIA